MLFFILDFFVGWMRLYLDFFLGLWLPYPMVYLNEPQDFILLTLSTVFLIVFVKYFRILPRFWTHILVGLFSCLVVGHKEIYKSFGMDQYAKDHSSRHHPVVAEMDKTISTQNLIAPTNMVALGLMQMVIQATGAKAMVEIGTNIGFSALMAAVVMPEDGMVTTIDLKDFVSRKDNYWGRANVSHQIVHKLGNALQVLQEIQSQGGEPFDMAFIDADKGNHPVYYTAVMKLLKPGGIIMIHDGMLTGEVLKENHAYWAVRAVAKLNDDLVQDPRVSVFLLPLFNGVTLIFKH